MGIVLTNAFVAGQPRDGAKLNADLEDVRKWLNGNVVAGDIINGAIASRHLLRPEHYGQPLLASIGTTFECYACSASMANPERAVFSNLVAGTDYIMCPELGRTVYLQRESLVTIIVRYYAWASFNAEMVSNNVLGVVGFTRLYINGAGVGHTTRRITIMDSGSGSPSFEDKREYAVHHVATLAAGYHDIYLGIRTLPHTYSAPADPIDDAANVSFNNAAGPPPTSNKTQRVEVQIRSFRVEINPFTV